MFLPALAVGETGPWEPVAGHGRWWSGIGLGVTLLVLIWVIGMTVLYQRLGGSIAYVLADDGLQIRRGRASTSVPYAEIARVEAAGRAAVQLTMRDGTTYDLSPQERERFVAELSQRLKAER